MAGRGRRPGDQGTRETILTSARAIFLEQGFTKAAVAAVARRAEVDNALVYHYFGNKLDLFVESMAGLYTRDRSTRREDSRPRTGVDIVEDFLIKWEQGPERPGQAFIALAQAASGSPEAAERVNEFVTQRIWRGKAGEPLDTEAARRASMVGSQLVGIAWARYILKLGPIATAPLHDVARWFGPTIDSFLEADHR
ncbi:TetR/AcrR family transcriptional regulator [Nocardia aobensis]|uniref:TetR/AcrR family transcriptional regulator n=1 Tax=Nocardia aobensis TaxID=257277 RepID=UPI0012F64B0C|nr:TetR family transcriptional regulator [Nocardia aobensis]